MRRCLWLLLCAAAIVGVHCVEAVAQPVTQVVALTGRAAPGTGANYGDFNGAPSINSVGQVAFVATLNGGSANSNNNLAVFAGQPSGLSLVARRGDNAPDNDAATVYRDVFTPAINDLGVVAFRASLNSGGTGNVDSLYVGPISAPRMFAKNGNLVPGTTNLTYSSGGYDLTVLSDTSYSAFGAVLGGSGSSASTNSGTMFGTPSGFSMIARRGDLAPGAGGSRYGPVGGAAVNDAGHVAFDANLNDGVPDTGNKGIFHGPGNSPQLLVRTRTAAPGMPAGTTFSSLGSPEINDAGHVAFGAGVTGTFSGGASYVYRSATDVVLVSRAGDQAPGLAAGVTYAGGIADLAINDSGQGVFTVDLAGTGVTIDNDRSIFAGPIESPALLAREGSQAAGLPAGVRYGHSISYLGLNDAGQIAFDGSITGTGVTSSNNYALWIHDPQTGTHLIAREGQSFPVGNGQFKTIAPDFSFHSLQSRHDDELTALSNGPYFTFGLDFTDGTSGIFVTYIPEPSALALGVPVIAWLMCRRRR